MYGDRTSDIIQNDNIAIRYNIWDASRGGDFSTGEGSSVATYEKSTRNLVPYTCCNAFATHSSQKHVDRTWT